jgi:integrase
VASLPRSALLERVEEVARRGADPSEASALLGGEAEPPITVSRALELYWGFARDLVLNKSPDQLRRWRNPRIKAVKTFIDVIGDKPLAQITRDDMLAFREFWLNRIEEEGVKPNSANKDLTHLGGVLRMVVEKKKLAIVLPLGGLALKEGDKAQRLPFSDGWIRDRLLAPGALDGMNDQERCILQVVINTGMRPSEVAALRSTEIALDVAVPHLSLQPIGRELKSASARRVIPLLGIALAAMRAFP